MIVMSEALPLISNVHFEQSPERIKIVLPVERHWAFLILYTVMVMMWLALLVGGLVFTFRDIAFSGERYAFVFTIMLLTGLFILFRFGRHLGRQWANYLANREILFVNPEELIIRRPVSIFGNTDVYGMEHISGFYIAEKPQSAAFDYGARHIYFGEALTAPAQAELVQFLNRRFNKSQPVDD